MTREKLGFEELRPGQEEAVRALTAGRDTLVVMTTGSGKSAIYQIAGWVIDGATSATTATRSRSCSRTWATRRSRSSS